MPLNLRYSEALDHLYALCECLEWDPELTSNLITLETELNYRQCIQSEQSSNTKDSQDQSNLNVSMQSPLQSDNQMIE